MVGKGGISSNSNLMTFNLRQNIIKINEENEMEDDESEDLSEFE